MKKVLSLVLAFAMILGSFGFVFASDFSDVKDTEYYSEPVNVLSGLGVIAGFPDGTFKPADQVTRAQMATMITAALGIPVKGSGATGFSDVPASHWASGYIAYAVSVGFVAGYPDKTFKPENPVSYNEALTMIVASLGYTAESLPGAWPGAFINKARGLGIMDICSTTGNAAAPRQDIACFLYKALTSPIGYVNKDGTWVANEGKDGEDDNMLARLGAHVLDLNDDHKIDDKDFFVIQGDEPSDINLKNYLGAYATVYVNKDDEIIAIKELKSEFIEGTYEKLDDTYKLDEDAIKASVDKFTNGDRDGSSALNAFKDESDSLKVAVKLNGKKVTEIYSIQVWEAAETFMAASDVQEEIAEDQKLNGYPFTLDDDDKVDGSQFALEGVGALSEIKEDDVVTVYTHKKDSTDKTFVTGDIVRVEVSNKTVEGKVTKINSAKDEFTVAGTAYGLNEDNHEEYAIGDEGTFFLDYAGAIFHFEATDDTSSNYGVILEFGSETARYGTEAIYAKVFMADGTVKEFEVKADATKDYDAATGKVDTDAATWTNPDFAKADKGLLVKYTVNAKDQISKIAVAGTRTADANGEFDANGVYKKAVLKSNATVFSFSGDATKDADLKNADNYEVVTAASMYDAKFTAITPFLNDDKDYVAVILEGVKAGDDDYAFLIKYTADVDGATVWTALYDGGVNKEFQIDSDLGTSFTTGASILYKVKVSDGIASVCEDSGKTPVSPAPVVSETKATTVSGNVLKDAEGTAFSLDEKIVVYVQDAKGNWSAGKASAMNARAGKLTSIMLINTDTDTDYDIAVVVTK